MSKPQAQTRRELMASTSELLRDIDEQLLEQDLSRTRLAVDRLFAHPDIDDDSISAAEMFQVQRRGDVPCGSSSCECHVDEILAENVGVPPIMVVFTKPARYHPFGNEIVMGMSDWNYEAMALSYRLRGDYPISDGMASEYLEAGWFDPITHETYPPDDDLGLIPTPDELLEILEETVYTPPAVR